MLLLRVDMESLGHQTIQHRFCCQLMLPTRRTQASLLGDWFVCVKYLRLSFKKTLSRAPRVDAKLISSNPSLLDMRDYCLYCSQVSVKSSLRWRAILSSPLLGVENNTLSLFIVTELYNYVKYHRIQYLKLIKKCNK